MNANEVIANLRRRRAAHPNDHVNMGQSSNDVFPSAVRLAALGEVTHDLLPALRALEEALDRQGGEFADVVKSGRTHLADAVPITLGQEFAGYAAQIGAASSGSRRPAPGRQLPLGGTAVGTGLNSRPEFAASVASASPPPPGCDVRAPNHFEAQGNRDAPGRALGGPEGLALALSKIANDLR